MGTREEEYVLAGRIESDEGYFSTERVVSEKDQPLNRGRGNQLKTKALVMTERELVESAMPGAKPRQVGYLKMKVIDDLHKEMINEAVQLLAGMQRQSIPMTRLLMSN